MTTKVCMFWLGWLIASTQIRRVSCQEPFATLPQGRIAGTKVYTKSLLTPVEIFYGIPYAVPPTGRYRFSAPERHGGWRRTFFAHRAPPRCPQPGDSARDYVSEDCLFLNIWTPRKNVNARGNLALLDQYLALLWVRENIAAFGGDPASVTLLGHSAGADSILYHIASQRAVGLFHRAIIMSPRELWMAIDEESNTKSLVEAELASKQFAHDMGCPSGSGEEVLRCLRSTSFSEIMRVYSNMNWTNGMHPIPDNFLPETEQYLPKALADAFSVSIASQPAMQLDLLLGTTDLEAINNNYDQYQELENKGKKTLLDYAAHVVIPELLSMLSLHNSNVDSMLIEAILWEYWNAPHADSSASGRAAESLARMESAVRWGASGALLAARLARRLSRLYVYRYTQPAGTDLRGRQLNFTGAAHGADLVAMLGDAMMLQVARRPAGGGEQQASLFIRRFIVNFIKFGSPAAESEWPRYRVGEAHVHSLQAGQACDQHGPSRDVAFWLQYLPHLVGLFAATGNTDKLPLEQGESRLRGGVFALCGVSLALLALLAACAAALRWERARRRQDHDDPQHTNL